MPTQRTFGYGKTYDWSSTYWSTLTNVQDTNITGPTTSDGWKVLGWDNIDVTKEWTNLTGWTTQYGTGGEVSISGGNTLHLYAANSSGTRYALAYNTTWNPSDSTYGIGTLVKVTSYSTQTITNTDSGFFLYNIDGARLHIHDIRSDGTNIDIYSNNGSTVTKTADTSLTPDTSRYHLWMQTSGSSNNDDAFYWDGIFIASGKNDGGAHAANQVNYQCQNTATNGTEVYGKNLVHVSATNPYYTDDGVMESDATDAVFDAGSGNVWKKLYWTDDTSNSTAITYEVRCASTSGGLAGASYETISASGDSIVTQDRYIQIKVTFADASSGQYTPILKDLTAEYDTGGAATAIKDLIGGGFILFAR